MCAFPLTEKSGNLMKDAEMKTMSGFDRSAEMAMRKRWFLYVATDPQKGRSNVAAMKPANAEKAKFLNYT